MKLRVLLAVAAVALGSGGCDSHRPASPTAPLDASPEPLPSASQWLLDQTFVSVEGPEGHCMVRDRLLDIDGGNGWRDQPIQVQVADDRASFSYMCDDFIWCDYAGALDALEFSAEGNVWSGTWTCSSSERFSYTATSSLAGSFAPDFGSFSGIERWIYATPAGEVVVSLDFRVHKPAP